MLEITIEGLNKTAYNNRKCPGPVHIHTFCDVIYMCTCTQDNICVLVLEICAYAITTQKVVVGVERVTM